MWVRRVSALARAAFCSRTGSPAGLSSASPPQEEGGCREKVTLELLDHLERLALVDFRDQEGVECLQKAIEFADQLHSVNTDDIQPMDSVLEDRCLYLREDKVTEGNFAEELLKNANQTVEEYFICPPGNIPLPQLEDRDTFLQKKKPVAEDLP